MLQRIRRIACIETTCVAVVYLYSLQSYYYCSAYQKIVMHKHINLFLQVSPTFLIVVHWDLYYVYIFRF